MNTTSFIPALEKLSEILETGSNNLQLRKMVEEFDLREDTIEGFLKSLIDSASAVNLTFVTQEFTEDEFGKVKKQLSFPLLVFSKEPKVQIVILYDNGDGLLAWRVNDEECVSIPETEIRLLLENLHSYHTLNAAYAGSQESIPEEETTIFCLAPVELKSMFGKDVVDELSDESLDYTPVGRFWKFVTSEKKNITYIYVYALIIGIINLSLPLGIQAIIGRISGGLLFDGVVVLIVFVILGILIAGGLQIMQIYLVEILQRRIFAKAAFEFAFRIPRIKTEALLASYPPELINRFFDIITLQKGFSKVLLDLTTASLQIIFGLMLLAFYHTSFVFFGLFLLFVMLVVFRLTGPKGLETSLTESKYKYALVSWLEEMARTMRTFKLAGYSSLPLDRTDEHVDKYLYARKSHFKVLLNQFITITLFKLLVTGGTLIIGCLLVVNREITLGQFVASEIVIILILGAVEKIVLNMDTIYDVLTAVEKVGFVTDLPLDSSAGIALSKKTIENGITLKLDSLSFTYPGKSKPTLSNLNLEVKPGERVCITGINGSGKATLSSIISGILTDYKGLATVNGIPLKNIRNSDLHELISGNAVQEEIFQGTIDENIRIGNKSIRHEDVAEALAKAGLLETINKMPEGIYSRILPGGKGLAKSVVRKLQLARTFAAKPKLLLFNDLFDNIEKTEKMRLIGSICAACFPESVIAFSTDINVMKMCDKVVLLSDGQVIAEGSFDDLKNHEVMRKIIPTND
ncbi:MAG: ATP-binding cassette domain-containing protein [Bacteroidia bacterium]